jgi:peroxiredoxin
MRVPSVALRSTAGSKVDLSSCQGRSAVFCYPWTGRPGHANPPNWDDIPGAHGSTPQAVGFRDIYNEYRTRNVAVYGLSTQDSGYQRELVTRLGLPFATLSDSKRAFQKALNLPTFKTGGVIYLVRLTLIIEDGVLRDRLFPVDPPEDSAVATLARLDAL